MPGNVPTGGIQLAVTDHQALIQGNFKSYAAPPYAAWTGMWGTYLPQNAKLQAASSLLAFPGAFPDGSIFTWAVTRDPNWSGVNGFLHCSYGNYDDSPGQITPRQVVGITTLAATVDWTFEGDPSSGLLCECYLTPEAVPTGPLATKSFEVAFFPKLSPNSAAFAQGLTPVGSGSYTDRNGITWNVGQGGTYFVAYRPGHADFRGTLRFDDLFAFLVASKAISGAEWFNGLAFGVEPYSGTGSLTVDKFAVAYA